MRFGADGTSPTHTGLTAVPGASATSSQDVPLAKYTDDGSTGTYNWAQVGGGTDQSLALTLSGQQVYAAGVVVPAATFGSAPIAQPVGSSLVLTHLADATLTLPVQLVAFTAAAAGPAAGRLT